MTGGAFKNTSNLLGRKREIEELEEACKKALFQVDRTNENLVLQEGLLAGFNEEMEKQRQEKQALYLEQNTV